MKNPRINESLIIGVDFSKRDDGMLIVGRQKNGEVTIINAFQGKELYDLIHDKPVTDEKSGIIYMSIDCYEKEVDKNE